MFPIHICGEYRYDALHGASAVLPADYFEEQSWEVRLMMEGEDRLVTNQNVKVQSHQISYSPIAEDWAALGFTEDLLEELIKRETMKQIFSEMTECQRRVVRMYFFEEMTHLQIASELGICRQAVTDMLAKAVCRVRRANGITETRISRKKK